MRIIIIRSALAVVFVLLLHAMVWAQRIEGVRGFDGGVAPRFDLVGPGSLYLDSQGTQGYLYNRDTFQTYSFRTPGGPAWSGALMTLGPNLTIGLIQGANQAGSGVRLPSAPRQTSPLPLIQSTIQSISILQTPSLPQTPFPALPDFDQIP